jgi:signal transduction histidine kinase
MKNKPIIFLVVITLAFICTSGWAKTISEMVEESVTYCKNTAAQKATPEMIISKVDKAANLLEKEGKSAFPKFMGNGSEFLFAGTYIWVNDLNGVILMHPVKEKLWGKNLTGIKDRTGKRFIAMGIYLAEEEGSGWIGYSWPKPGQKSDSPKASYVKMVHTPDGDMVLGCGVYDMNDELVSKGYEIH